MTITLSRTGARRDGEGATDAPQCRQNLASGPWRAPHRAHDRTTSAGAGRFAGAPNVRRTSLGAATRGEVPRSSVRFAAAIGFAAPHAAHVGIVFAIHTPQDGQNTGIGVRRGGWGSYCMTLPRAQDFHTRRRGQPSDLVWWYDLRRRGRPAALLRVPKARRRRPTTARRLRRARSSARRRSTSSCGSRSGARGGRAPSECDALGGRSRERERRSARRARRPCEG